MRKGWLGNSWVALAGLMVLAAALGVYLIATTVLISKDSVLYIEQAQRLAGEREGAFVPIHVGYSYLIIHARWVFGHFMDPCDVLCWIYSAQAVSLLCRVLCLVPIYLIGRRFVGRRGALVGILILIVLPKPAHYGADALSDWPGLLVLLIGLWLLIVAAEGDRPWLFAISGLVCGAGVWIREETLAPVVYGVLWLFWHVVVGRRGSSRLRKCLSLVVLLVSASIPVACYIWVWKGRPPPHTRVILKLLSRADAAPAWGQARIRASVLAFEKGSTPDAVHRIAQKVGMSLHEVFGVFWLVGLLYHLRAGRRILRRPPPGGAVAAEPPRRRRLDGSAGFGWGPARVLVAFFMIGSVALLFFRYFVSGHTVSTRWAMPLTAGTIYFAPLGLRLAGVWMERLGRRRWPAGVRALRRRVRVRTILLVAGILICLPNLVRPIGSDRRNHRLAASWLAENTPPDALVATTESTRSRIAFHADRRVVVLSSLRDPQLRSRWTNRSDYLVVLVDKGQSAEVGPNWQPVPDRKGWPGRRDRVVIYRRRRAGPQAPATRPKKAPRNRTTRPKPPPGR